MFYVPLILMFVISLDNWASVGMFKLSALDPARFSLDNYALLVKYKALPRLYIVTAAMASVAAIGGALIATAGGYGLLRAGRRLRSFTVAIIAITTAVPTTVIVIPLFIEMHYLGITGVSAVLLKGMLVSSGVIVAWQYMKGIPQAYFDSATIDGAGDLQVIWHILIPISKPLFALTAIGQGILFANDYLWQTINLVREVTQTAVVALTNMIITTSFLAIPPGEMMRRFNVEMAAGIAMLVPMLFIFFIGRKHLLNFTLEGGVKQ